MTKIMSSSTDSTNGSSVNRNDISSASSLAPLLSSSKNDNNNTNNNEKKGKDDKVGEEPKQYASLLEISLILKPYFWPYFIWVLIRYPASLLFSVNARVVSKVRWGSYCVFGSSD